MSLSRFVNYGKRLFNQFYDPLRVNSTVPGAALSKFISTAFDPRRCLKSSELTLSSFTPLIFSSRGMKVKGVLKLRCKHCYFERKDGIMYVNCSSYPRHKQRGLMKKPKYQWILTFASQSKFRPY